MNLIERLKIINKQWYQHLNKNSSGYIFNKKVFTITLIILFLFTGIVYVLNPNDAFNQNLYLECNYANGCLNPFYKDNYLNEEDYKLNCPDKNLCEIKFFLPGTSWGVPPNFWFKYSQWFMVGFILLGLLVNHFFFNRGFKFEMDLEDYK
jgi:hypothetical protein